MNYTITCCLLIIDVVLYAESRIEIARNKRIPTQEDLHPNTRFIENRLVEQLRNNDSLLQVCGPAQAQLELITRN